MEEYTKLSIHNHFGGKLADLTIDRPVTDRAKFDLAVGYKELSEAQGHDYRLLAQTNSNRLDVASYVLMRRMASYCGIELLPGAEINLINWQDASRVLHVVVVADPESNLLEFAEAIDGFFQENGRFALSIDQLCEVLCNRRAVLCVHGLKQDDRGLSRNPEMAQEVLSLNRYLPVAVEDNKSYHKLMLKSRIQDFLAEQNLKWFDVAANLSSVDRQRFGEAPSPSFMWAGSTFDDLFYSVLVGSSRIVREEDIVSRVSYVSRIVVEDGANMKHSEINCSQGLNCIIGPSGSGKTLLLDVLKMKLKGQHLSAGISNVGNYSGLYDPSQVRLYGPDDREIELSEGFEVIEGEDLYAKVIKAYGTDSRELLAEMGLDIDGRGFAKLIDEFKDGLNRYLRGLANAGAAKASAGESLAQVKSAARFVAANDAKQTDIIAYNRMPDDEVAINALNEKIETCSKGTEAAKRHFSGLERIAVQNELSEDLQERLAALKRDFLVELEIRTANLDAMRLSRQLEKGKKDLLFASVQSYNQKVSGRFHQLNDKKQLIIDKLAELAEELVNAKKLELGLEVPTLSKEDIEGSFSLVEESGIARLSTKSVSLAIADQESMRKLLPNHVRTNAAKGKAKASSFSYPLDLSSSKAVEGMLDILYGAGVKEGVVLDLSLDDVVTYSIELRDEGGDFRPLETYSAGMLSKIYVSYFLDRAIQDAGSNTILLYDQPESNMEKEFLLKTLGDKLRELRKVHQIFVATHEPLLVVNADANEIILATNEKRVDTDNCISYKNRSFVGAHGKSQLIEGVARLIDGGTDAVKHRSGIYEGMIHK